MFSSPCGAISRRTRGVTHRFCRPPTLVPGLLRSKSLERRSSARRRSEETRPCDAHPPHPSGFVLRGRFAAPPGRAVGQVPARARGPILPASPPIASIPRSVHSTSHAPDRAISIAGINAFNDLRRHSHRACAAGQSLDEAKRIRTAGLSLARGRGPPCESTARLRFRTSSRRRPDARARTRGDPRPRDGLSFKQQVGSARRRALC
jgi:hypothetical protein